jgi:hypothetical protein
MARAGEAQLHGFEIQFGVGDGRHPADAVAPDVRIKRLQ